MILAPDELSRSDFRRAILRALRRTYEVTQELHEPNYGHDAMSFGHLTWKSSTHFLPMELAGIDGVACVVKDGSLEIRVGGCKLRTHKLGSSETDNAWECFPNHPGPAARMGRVDQLELDLEMDALRPYDWVIGHYGSPEEGLRAVRLQAIGTDRTLEGTIARWLAVETIYDAAAGIPLPFTVVAPVHDDVVVTQEADISLRPEARGDANTPEPS
jgi:hypothetical protein